MCRSPEAVCSLPEKTELKEQLIRGLWLTHARERKGYGMQGAPAAAEAGMTLQQPEARRVFSRGSCPWIMGLAVAGSTGSCEESCG